MTRLPTITEAEFTDQVLALARLYGWRTAHFRPARTARGWATAVQGDGKGFPDLVLVRGSKLIFAELKVGKNKVAPDQQAWLDALMATGVVVKEWRPEDWNSIERMLEEM